MHGASAMTWGDALRNLDGHCEGTAGDLTARCESFYNKPTGFPLCPLATPPAPKRSLIYTCPKGRVGSPVLT